MTPAEELHAWYVALVTAFRDAVTRLPQQDADQISLEALYDLRAPCQVEVFWLANVLESEIVFITKDSDRDDGLVTLHGPWSGNEFPANAGTALEQGHWLRPWTGHRLARANIGNTLGSAFGSFVGRCIQKIKLLSFVDIPPSAPRRHDFTRLLPLGSGFLWLGSSLRLDPCTVAEDIVSGWKGKIGHRPRSVPAPPSPAVPSPPAQRSSIRYFGAHFYPPMLLDAPEPDLPVVTRILGVRPDRTRRLASATRNNRIIIHTDGLVLVAGPDASRALDTLNRVFAAALVSGVPCDAARIDELFEFQLDAATFDVRSSGGRVTSLRSLQFDEETWFEGRREIARKCSRDQLDRILNRAAVPRVNRDLASECLWLLQAATFLRAAEFAQAFLMAWLIVERDTVTLFRALLDDRKLDDGRKGKLLMWTLDRQLETLNLAGYLDDATFNRLGKLKDVRNAFVHKAAPVSQADVMDVLNYASGALAERLFRADLLQLLRRRGNRRPGEGARLLDLVPVGVRTPGGSDREVVGRPVRYAAIAP